MWIRFVLWSYMILSLAIIRAPCHEAVVSRRPALPCPLLAHWLLRSRAHSPTSRPRSAGVQSGPAHSRPWPGLWGLCFWASTGHFRYITEHKCTIPICLDVRWLWTSSILEDSRGLWLRMRPLESDGLGLSLSCHSYLLTLCLGKVL